MMKIKLFKIVRDRPTRGDHILNGFVYARVFTENDFAAIKARGHEKQTPIRYLTKDFKPLVTGGWDILQEFEGYYGQGGIRLVPWIESNLYPEDTD
jgi:hypothetical protein